MCMLKHTRVHDGYATAQALQIQCQGDQTGPLSNKRNVLRDLEFPLTVMLYGLNMISYKILSILAV